MARHSENCNGEVEDAENGGLSPKKGRRGRKKKMRSKRDEDDSEEDQPELEEEDDDEGEEDAALLQEDDEPEGMELDQAPAAIPVPAPDEPPVKRKRGRPPKNPPKPPTPSKPMKTAVRSPAADAAIIQYEDEGTEAVEDMVLKKEEEEDEDPAGGVTLTVEEGESGDVGVETVELSVSEETAAAAANGDLTPEMILSMMDR